MRSLPGLAGVALFALGAGTAAASGQTGQAAGRALAQAAGQRSPVFGRAEHLRHGVNTALWFAQSPADYTVNRLQTFTTDRDLQLIASLGFDHIRLSIDPVPLTEWQQGRPEGKAFVAELDRVVQVALVNKLAVVLDIHPESSYKQKLLQGEAGVADFDSLWKAFASHFAQADAALVFFELMNEPEQSDRYRWQGIEAGAIAAIRSVDTVHTLIAGGAHWSGLSDLLNMEPFADTNVIYTFHDYDPFPFTHQGATWAGSELIPLREVPYPATPDGVAKNLSQEPTLAGALFVEAFAMSHWDADRIDRTLAFAERWGQQYGVPVYCGEFGVFRRYADPAARQRWLHDMRVAMDRHRIGWSMWDYQTDFGVVRKTGTGVEVDRGVVEALGLKAEK